VDVAQLPSNQDANEQQYGETNPKRQGSRHVVGLGFAYLLVLFAAFEHEIQGSAQAAQNCDESNNCDICHSWDYRVSLKTLNFRFWLITLAALTSAAVTLRLGFWQQSRAHEKLALQASIQRQAALPALNASALMSPLSPSVLHRTVTLTGHWLPQYTLFLDNRQMDAKPGLFVLTPFEFEDSSKPAKKVILVQRGWLPRNFLDRNKLPEVAAEAADAAEVTITGRIAPSPSKLFEFKGAETGAIRQNVAIDDLAKEFKIELLPYSLLQLDGGDAHAGKDKRSAQLLRHWTQPDFGSEKNYGYMVQWWALSALITLLYLWFQLIRPFIKSKNNTNHTAEKPNHE
jgi:surfeit locus 1 family protein